MFGEGAGTSEQPYKFGGKELDRMHGLDWYDFTGRIQDPSLPVFTTMDPMCEKYYEVSPYAYCMNNPIRYIDPSGMLFGDYYDAHTGKHIYNNGKDDNEVYTREITWEIIVTSITAQTYRLEKVIKDTHIGTKDEIPDKTEFFNLL